jgi:DNA modification methylase
MRDIICTDAIKWLSDQTDNSLDNIVSGIPDLAEMQLTLEEYIIFFKKAVDLIFKKTKSNGYVVLIQTDRKHNKQWLDKSSIINKIAEDNNIPLRWHKIILNRKVGSIHLQRPTYSHFLCFSKDNGPGNNIPDVILGDKKLYKNATYLNVAEMAIKFILLYSRNKMVVDPFVGQGTIVAMANKYKMNSIGIDIDNNQCEKSRKLIIK